MTISPLAKDLTYILGNKKSKQRSKSICRITPHHVAGVVTGEKSAVNVIKYWRDKVDASANYIIDVEGKIYCAVNEERRAWTSSNSHNDDTAVTFEMSNNVSGSPWSISDKTIEAAAKLSADVCKRYGITPLYTGNKEASITVHRMFASTQCPGDWFMNNWLLNGRFTERILHYLHDVQDLTEERMPWFVQIGAYKRKGSALSQASTLQGYSVIEQDGFYKVRQYFMTKAEADHGKEIAKKYPKAWVGQE